ncbi:MAG: long-chain fatty acid--CoA ligase [Candidatus Eremiobacteraeota bacterium]|nr:long-chain fatty acid--CoA ligase [Candidatus Eremiobacteraeota bacterium]
MHDCQNVAALFHSRVLQTPNSEAFRYPVENRWESLTWQQTRDRVQDISGGLLALGLQPEERCAILSGTCIDWILADLGILCASGATTTIYPSNTAPECAFILSDSGTRFVFAESDEQVAKLQQVRGDIPKVEKVIVFQGTPSQDEWVITLEQLSQKGRGQFLSRSFEDVTKDVTKDKLATLIYTSGTTGHPKGVELLHDCWIYESEGIAALNLLRYDDLQYLWLPLAHSFGKVLQMAQLRIGFATAVDGRPDKLVDNLAVIRPTFVAAVPRIFEKIYAKMVSGAKEKGGWRQKVFNWAMKVGRQVSRLQQEGKRPGLLLSMKHYLASRLVFSKLHGLFGGRLRFFVSGSAPLSASLNEFFHAAGVIIYEGYGLTETSAATFVNFPGHNRIGTVGSALPGTEVKLAEGDSEILIKGRGVMRAYHNQPEMTAETFDSEGYLKTGDIGTLEDGFLRITDRKKDLIKTSGGKYVAPQALEAQLKMACPQISQVLVHGNNRNFCSCLVALDPAALKSWATQNGLTNISYEELTRNEKVREMMQGVIETLNKTLPSYETLKKFAILPADLTLEAGDLTPSLKLKRKAVEAKYKDLLDSFYTGGKD